MVAGMSARLDGPGRGPEPDKQDSGVGEAGPGMSEAGPGMSEAGPGRTPDAKSMDGKLDILLENDAQSLESLGDLRDGGLLRVPWCRAARHLPVQCPWVPAARVAGRHAAAACPAPRGRALRLTVTLAVVRSCGLRPQRAPGEAGIWGACGAGRWRRGMISRLIHRAVGRQHPDLPSSGFPAHVQTPSGRGPAGGALSYSGCRCQLSAAVSGSRHQTPDGNRQSLSHASWGALNACGFRKIHQPVGIYTMMDSTVTCTRRRSRSAAWCSM